MAQLIAKRYAKALFDIALENHRIDEFEHQVHMVYQILDSEKEFMKILQHPQILMDEK